MIIEKTGNIFDTTARAIGHGINCEGVMGSGIAKEVRKRYPEVYHDYMAAYWRNRLRPGRNYPFKGMDGKIIMNISSQDKPGRYARMDWLIDGVWEAVQDCQGYYQINTLALPQIGCGIGGLDWKDVHKELEKIANYSDMVNLELWTFGE